MDGVKRIRYTTSHPRDMDDDLIAAHGDIKTLMPMLHLPVQSGSDRILKAMNRKHTAADYIAIVEKLRAARPDMAFSSDFIVGFPGETDADFEDTLKLVETVGFAASYVFAYSPRPGTPAANKDEQVPDDVAYARMQRLMKTIGIQQLRFNRQMVGSTQPVLIERLGRKEGQVIGKTPFMQSVVLENAVHRMGTLVDVAITEAYEFSLKGEATASLSGRAA
jgi:tRNA-2-methylthio-N6-dimethylallyladenosine synthase